MSSDFPAFSQRVAARFKLLAAGHVLVSGVSPDDLTAAYLAAFPEGTNPIFKERTEHDCSCCKSFIRHAGGIVTVDDAGNKIQTVWDDAAENAPYPYNVVAAAMRDKVLSLPIDNIFRASMKEPSFGAQTSKFQDPDTKKVLTWNHLYTGEIPSHLRVASPGEVCGSYRTTVGVFERGLNELSPDAVSTVLDLINANSLYRGEEHKKAVEGFQKVQKTYRKLPEADRYTYVWANANDPSARFRNTVIGTLVQDLSEGVDLEKAVKSFEAKVAPQNYKRTSALITPAMVQKAMETIQELDLEPALERRFAKISDISVQDVLWVDGAAKPLMKGGVGALLMAHAQKTSPATVSGQVEDITIAEFMSRILPEATGMEVLFQNQHVGNLMALTAPVHPEPRQLFRWDNDFGWSYGGNVADSYLRQQVQSLGGRVDGVLRFSHMWNHDKRNASLMDLHVFMPGSTRHSDGDHDNYPAGQRVGWNQRNDHASGGVQDVDYTHPAPEGYVPVENITFPKMDKLKDGQDKLKDGQYTFKIHNWSLRQPTQGGFRAEIEFGGQVFQYDHPAPLRHKEWITLAVATLKAGVFTIEHKHPVGTSSQDKWGLTTGQFVKVNTVTLSPNHWGDNAVGNKHVFFVLDGCKADEDLRGIYNEFLHPRLEQHRKVFEVIGDKTKCKPTEGQLAGVGFSSTKKDAVTIRVRSNKGQRTYNVMVG